MKKRTKNLTIIFTCFIFCQALKCSNVLAEEMGTVKPNISTEYSTTEDIKKLSKYITANVYANSSSKENIPLDKVWNIKFSEELDAESIKGNIKIIDKNAGKEINANILPVNNKKTVSIGCNYEPNNVYSIVINKNIKSKCGKELKESLSMDFKTIAKTESKPIAEANSQERIKIDYIDNIKTTMRQKDEYNLPSTVDAVMSNGKTNKVKVSWDKTLKNTNDVGEYSYCGTVSGYEKKVKLQLTIIPLNETNSETSSDTSKNENIVTHSTLQKNLYDYLMSEENRVSIMERAVQLHDGDASNTCVYFASESLRRSGLTNLSESVCNTVTLTSKLKGMGWKTSTDLSQLKSGDICFTTSYGYGPTHTYIFMKWIDPNYHEYGYICDNQGYEYGNSYHKRNINFATTEKDVISYFMYMP